MDSHTQMLVHHLIASRLLIEDEETVADTRRFDELGLDTLDLVFVSAELEELAGASGPFPVGGLADAETVADLVALVDAWLAGGRTPQSLEGRGGDDGQHAA